MQVKELSYPQGETKMKYVLVLCDGMADYPVDSLGGKTPLEAAHTPNMDSLAQTAQIGLVKTIPDGMTPGSDVANLGALGFDARSCYTGRSPLEALSIGIDMKTDDLAVRTNLVTLSDDEPFEDKIMIDYSAGEISDDEARELMACVKDNLSSDGFKFYTGASYRNCLIASHQKAEDDLTPPHDISERRIGEYLPKGPLGKDLTSFIYNSYQLLKDHPVNLRRIARGENPANAIWFWGEGTKPSIPNFEDIYDKKGVMISAVDLLKGIAVGCGMTSIDVEGATGTLDTNFEGKAQAAIDALDDGADFCFVHIEATDECGHQGDAEGKIKAIEFIDEKIISPIVSHFAENGEDLTMLVMPDHYTPVSLRKHCSDPVPYMLFSTKIAKAYDSICTGKEELFMRTFSEKSAKESGVYYEKPWQLIDKFFGIE